MPPTNALEVLLARRPKPGEAALGHVNVSAKGRHELDKIVSNIALALQGRTEVPYHPDGYAEDHEVMATGLNGFDQWFQAKAPWSLERVVGELRSTNTRHPLDEADVRDGHWGFYAIRTPAGNTDAIVVRGKSPTYGLGSQSKFFTTLVGTQLVPVDTPLVAFEHRADLVVLGQKVFVLNPRRVEQLLVDADEVKARAPQTTQAFAQKLAAPLSPSTVDAVQRACSRNANVARRVERLIRDGALSRVTASEVRAALPDAGLKRSDFGKGSVLDAGTEPHAVVLIDIAADLYYQPRFQSAPRRVASYRNLN